MEKNGSEEFFWKNPFPSLNDYFIQLARLNEVETLSWEEDSSVRDISLEDIDGVAISIKYKWPDRDHPCSYWTLWQVQIRGQETPEN